MESIRPPAPLILTVEQVAERLGVGTGLVYRSLRDGTLPGIRLGKRWLVPESRLDEFLASA